MTVPESLLDLIRPEVRAQRPYAVSGARKVAVKLNQNESPFDIPADLKRELLESFFQISFNRYPSEQPVLLQHELETHCKLKPGSILVGNGSNELTYTLGMCFIHPGDEVVVARPMFALYETAIKLHGGIPVGISPREDLQFDVEAILEAINEHQPKLVVVTSPNNPTGLSMAFSDIERIVTAAPGFVVVDEAYHEFNPEPSALTLLQTCPNVIVMRTLSKAFGLAGLRLGYMVAAPDVISEVMKSRLPYMVDRFSEQVGILLIRNHHIVDERVRTILKNTANLTSELLNRPDVEVLPSQTNFVLFKTRFNPEKMLNMLADKGTLVRNMAGYPELKNYLRVTSGTCAENKAFLKALDSSLALE